jgi:hypothetical protein
MGRGRAKAKQTKVARELKYHSPNTDLAALQRELGGQAGADHDTDTYDDYVDGADDTDDDEDDESEDDGADSWSTPTRRGSPPAG